MQYFKLSPHSENSGSLIKGKKADFGHDFMDGLINRYFKDHEIAEILKHKEDIQNYLVEKFEVEKLKIEEERKKRLEIAIQEEELLKQGEEKKTEEISEEKDETKKVEEKVVAVESIQNQETNEDEDNMFLDDEDDEEIGENKPGNQDISSKKRDEMLKKLKDKIGGKDNYRRKDIKVEYNEEGYVKTFGDRVKRIEFVGFDQIWERLYNLNRIIDISLSEQKISNFGNLGQLGGICPNIKNLSLEKNLLCSWDQIIILGSELRNLESLALSYNPLRLENEEGFTLNKLRSFNEKNEILNCELKNEEIFPKLKNLILIQMNLDFKMLSTIMPFFQHIDELVLCNNYCNDFENIVIENFKNIKKINLENNQIDSENHQIERLSEFKELERLSLLSNKISKFPVPEKFQKLEQLNISKNNFLDGKIFSDLSKMKSLTHLRMKYNPVNYKYNKGHSRQWAIAEIPNLTYFNGLKVGKSERTDSEYYIMRHAFHEYFNTFEKTQFNYKFSEFVPWAKENYPISLTLIEKYENPYPEINYEKLKEAGMGELPGQRIAPTVHYVKISFLTMVGPFMGKPPFGKKYPITTDFLYIRNWICQYFKIKKKDKVVLKFRNDTREPYEEIDDLTKGLDFYGMKEGSEILIEGEEE